MVYPASTEQADLFCLNKIHYRSGEQEMPGIYRIPFKLIQRQIYVLTVQHDNYMGANRRVFQPAAIHENNAGMATFFIREILCKTITGHIAAAVRKIMQLLSPSSQMTAFLRALSGQFQSLTKSPDSKLNIFSHTLSLR